MSNFISEEHFQVLSVFGSIPIACRPLAKLSAIYDEFHAAREEELTIWFEDRAAGEFGMRLLEQDEKFHSIRDRKALHTIMAQAHLSSTCLRPIIESEYKADFARKGGASRKLNVLQKAVSECLTRIPDITVRQLAMELEHSLEYDIEFDDLENLTIHDTRHLRFTDNTGKRVSKPVSCLKNYLRSAKFSQRANK